MGAALRLNSRAGAGRWHPYSHARTNIPTTHSSCTGLDTPASGQTKVTDTFTGATLRQTQSLIVNKNSLLEAKRAQKEKFEVALKDFSVKRLTEIWKETSYVANSQPSRQFTTSAAFAAYTHVEQPLSVKAETYLSPPLSPNPYAFQATAATAIPTRGMPLRPFVHDVLRRSKTAWPALQVALCYLDAVRDKVSEAIDQAKTGEGLSKAEAALDELFTSGNHSEAGIETYRPTTSNPTLNTPSTYLQQMRQTVTPPSSDDGSEGVAQIPDVLSTPNLNQAPKRSKRRRIPPVPAQPLPPRPSPLLCPRRMFVAALILACKFTQDRVYSNRAWARICGLEPREVSRCERALGEALNWRLWVGKGMKDEPTQFLRQWLLSDEGTLAPVAALNPALKKIPEHLNGADTLLTPQSSAGSPFASPPESSPPTATAPLTKSVSLDAGLFNVQKTMTTQAPTRDLGMDTMRPFPQFYFPTVPPMLNGGNCDFDSMMYDQPPARDLFCVSPGSISPSQIIESSIIGSPCTSSQSSSSSDEYSFIPNTGNGILSPPFSQCSPSTQLVKQEYSEASLLSANPPTWGGLQQLYDAALSAPAASMFEAGIEGKFDMSMFDDEFVVGGTIAAHSL